jgi:hypothetical protein
VVEEPVAFEAEPVVEEPVAFEAEPVVEEPVAFEAEPVVEEPVVAESFEPVEVLGGEDDPAPAPPLGFGFGFGFGQPSADVDIAGPSWTDDQHDLTADDRPVEVVAVEEAGEESPAADPEGDHYAALRAAMVEVGENLVDDAASDEELDGNPYGEPVFQVESDAELEGRAALQALLSEVTSADNGTGYAASDDPVDALADRGPWTQHELSAMEAEDGWSEGAAGHNGWTDGVETPSNVVPFAPVHEADADGRAGSAEGYDEVAEAEEAEAEDTEPAEEPINRGLLLKFLSSVRN